MTDLDDARAAVAGFSDADVLVLLDHDHAFDAVLVEGLRHRREFSARSGPATPRPPVGNGCSQRA